ncbi:ELWxxDGT repeat protein, partial [Pseudanabaena sp. CCNP1317]|uniref:ELWxxDGT repeat protein n=1 Tax=Pseudanabaena sp. CCNP1317 TaxID=3110253 RepID=UPI002B208A4E
MAALCVLTAGSATAHAAPPEPSLVKDINPGSASSSASNFTDIGGTLYFTATDPTNGVELWKSDGTAGGTTLVKDINPGNGSSSPNSFTNFGGTLFFSADDGTNGVELWKSDGTAGTTTLVKDIN